MGTNCKADCEFLYLAKRIRIPRADILTVKPRNGGGAWILTRKQSKAGILVLDDYAAIMGTLYGAPTTAVCGSTTKTARGITELADKLLERNETAARILYALRSDKGVFFGTAQDLAQKVKVSSNGDNSCRLFNARSVGKALKKFLPVFGDYLVVHKPRLLNGRTLYAFDGLRPGVEL